MKRKGLGGSLVVLVTGGTGSFGSAFVRRVLGLGHTVRVLSRDEFKQGVLRDELGSGADVRFFVGDVRDRARLRFAVGGADLVVHAAALKQVESCEYNPFEAIKTNVVGSQNVVEACLDAGVPRAVLLSTDKAVHPVNVYGASKLCAEKCWLAAGSYAGGRDVAFSAVRYGNVVGSRGSVHEKWGSADRVELTDRRATRFWLDLDAAVELVLLASLEMVGGEVFIPKVGSSRVLDLIPSGAVVDEVGLRRGEKLHEVLISDEEVPRTVEWEDHYVVMPDVASAEYAASPVLGDTVYREFPRLVPADFRYSSEVVAA